MAANLKKFLRCGRRPVVRLFSAFAALGLLSSAEANSTPSAAQETRIYLCHGARAAVIVVGHQTLDCHRVGGGPSLRIGFSAGTDIRQTGLTAEAFLGINVGLSVSGGILVQTCEVGFCDVYASERPRALRGGSGAIAFGLGGGAGRFAWPGQEFTLTLVHLGVLFEASLSALTIQPIP